LQTPGQDLARLTASDPGGEEIQGSGQNHPNGIGFSPEGAGDEDAAGRLSGRLFIGIGF
jgi:hypothetical protein